MANWSYAENSDKKKAILYGSFIIDRKSHRIAGIAMTGINCNTQRIDRKSQQDEEMRLSYRIVTLRGLTVNPGHFLLT